MLIRTWFLGNLRRENEEDSQKKKIINTNCLKLAEMEVFKNNYSQFSFNTTYLFTTHSYNLSSFKIYFIQPQGVRVRKCGIARAQVRYDSQTFYYGCYPKSIFIFYFITFIWPTAHAFPEIRTKKYGISGYPCEALSILLPTVQFEGYKIPV